MRNSRSGFSLLELVITLAIISIMMAGFPVARSMLPDVKINSAARGLGQEMREARALAVKHSNDVIVSFVGNQINVYSDTELDGIELSDLVLSHPLEYYGTGAVFRAVATTGIDGQPIAAAVKMGGTSNPVAVTFRANGAAMNTGVIYLGPSDSTRLDLGRAIEINSLGRVVLWKYDATGSPGPWKKYL